MTNEQRKAKLKALVIPVLRQRDVINQAFEDDFSNLTKATCETILAQCKVADINVLKAWAKATKDINPTFHRSVFTGVTTTLSQADINYLYSELM